MLRNPALRLYSPLPASKKNHRTVKHIYFLPTLKAHAQKNKRACLSPPPPDQSEN